MKILLYTILLLASLSFSDEKTYGNATVDTINAVHDGDTFTITFKNKSWPPIIKDHISIRLDGVDTPEMTDKRDSIKVLAQKAKDFSNTKLRSAKKITLKDMKRDKYFRIDATVIIDGWSLGDSLIALGLAHPYDGGTKTPW